MELIIFLFATSTLLYLHYLLFTERTKKYIEKHLGTFFIKRLYRFIYAVFSVFVFFIIFSSLLKLPYIEILNWQESLSNITYLILATIGGLVSCFLMIESLWTLGLGNLFGIKQLFSNKNTEFYFDYIITPLTIKGLYLYHRHPFLFYSIPFSLFVLPSFTTNNIIALLIISIYYTLFARMIESQLLSVYKTDLKHYFSKTNFLLPKFKKYKNEPIKK